MSRWPVGTGVLAAGGTAYFAAGLFADDGGTFYAVDARSGEVRWTQPLTAAKGAMAMGQDVVFVPTVGGSPRGFRLGGEKAQPVFNKIWHSSAYGARGTWVAAVGLDALVGSPDLIYTHHVVGYVDRQRLLPVVTDEAIFLRQGRTLTADRRAAYRLNVDKAMFITTGKPLEYGSTTSADPADRLWSAWPEVRTTAIVLAGGTLLTGGDGVVCATRAADGKALFKAAVEGIVTDLACQGGRMFAVTAEGRLTCLGAER